MKALLSLLFIAVFTATLAFAGPSGAGCPITTASPGTITTFAGNSSLVGLPPVSAPCSRNVSLGALAQTLVAADGTAYILDISYNQIHQVSTNGTITLFAGNATGVLGFAGDGGPPLSAKFKSPRGMCFDNDGNLIVADTYNYRVRKIDMTTMTVSTIAGNGSFPLTFDQGDGLDALSAPVQPFDVAISPVDGSLFIAEPPLGVVKRVDPSTNLLSTFAGNGNETASYGDGGPAKSAAIGEPYAVECDSNGNLYLGSFRQNLVRLVYTNSTIVTFAGNSHYRLLQAIRHYSGQATKILVNAPVGIAVSPSGASVFISEQLAAIVIRVDLATMDAELIAGVPNDFSNGPDGGLADQTAISSPTGVSLDQQGNLYITTQGATEVKFVPAQPNW